MLKWMKYTSYEDAKDITECIYVFAKGKKYLYVGRAKQFGGSDGRYAVGYRHLLDSLFKSGACVYIAKLSRAQWRKVRDYENTIMSNKNGLQAVNIERVSDFKKIKGLRGPVLR